MQIKTHLLFLLLFTLLSCDFMKQNRKPSLKTDKEKKSYFIGYSIGTGIKKNNEMDLDVPIFLEAIKHGLTGEKSLLKLNETANLQKQLFNENQKNAGSSTKDNLNKGRKFLEENKTKKNIKVTDSGLQYQIIKEGKGKTPGPESQVEVHYRGTLINGTEFDSSYKRNQIASFPLNRVIPGWTEGLQLMKEGAVYKFFIPPNLGYGSVAQRKIPPNSVLIFEVELIAVK